MKLAPFTGMTSHERLVAALRGQPVDRLPWSPFLAYWWEHQPAWFQEKGQPWFMKEIGADALLRGFATAFSTSYESDGCKIVETHSGDLLRTEYHTPLGVLTAHSRFSPDGNTTFVYDHPVKSRFDFEILARLVQGMRIQPDFALVAEPIRALGEDGLFVALVSPFGKTPFQQMIEYWVGTEAMAYALSDYPEAVEDCLQVMSERAFEAVALSIDSPAEAFISWEDSSTTNISPRMFARYIVPDLNRWGKAIHAAGKLFLHHACGHVRALMESMSNEEVDVIESLSPPPTGNIQVWEAQKVLSPRIGIVGGIEPVQFLTLAEHDLRAYVENLLARVNPCHYVLANSDSCPPGVSVEKFRLVTRINQANRF
jgi:uroporphyrinogen-III decarboxylase